MGNYTQINGKTIAVSGTRRAIDQAGVADEYAYQLKKRGTELRRDVEFDLIHTYNIAQSGAIAQSNPGTRTGYEARTFGGYSAWINQANSLEQTVPNQSLGGNVIYKGQFDEPTNNVATGRSRPRKTCLLYTSPSPRDS